METLCATIRFWEGLSMKWLKYTAFMSLFLFALVGCAEEKDDMAKVEEESTVGFEMANGKIEEAQNVPDEEKEAIIQLFNQYIDAFNAQDIEGYIATLAETEKGFKLEDEREALKSAFETYDVQRTADNITIVKYTGEEANVFSTIQTELVEKESGADLSRVGRQVTVMTKIDGTWKVTSVFYIGSE